MKIQIYRTPKNKLIHPSQEDYGRVALFFSLLGGFILLVLRHMFSPIYALLLGVFFVLVAVLGVVMIVIARSEDTEFMHAFAHSQTEDLFHITIWIPGRETPILSFPDNYIPAKILAKKQTTFGDMVDFIYSEEFESCILAKINGQNTQHPLAQHITVRQMLDPVITKKTRNYRFIAYQDEKGRAPHGARLSRKNEAYIRLSLHITHQTNDQILKTNERSVR